MIRIEKYCKTKKGEWDDFVSHSKNGTFLFYRDYMEYHSDRFEDYSLLFYHEDKLVAIFPANSKNETLYSHEGLTYGGFLSQNNMKADLMLKCFDKLTNYTMDLGFKTIIYKCIPYIYHKYASEEDLYALFRKDAKLIRRDISSTIYMENKIEFNTLRKRMIKKSLKADIKIHKQDSPEYFYPILLSNLKEKYNTTPVHSIEELKYLAGKFPKNISFYGAQNKHNETLAGVMLFETNNTIHVQYIASLPEGRKIGALDAIFNHIINNSYKDKKFLDFGICTEEQGQYLNQGLINQKETFGGRGICYDTYKITLE